MSNLIPAILTINAGSSNVKFALYEYPSLTKLHAASSAKIFEVFSWLDYVAHEYVLHGVGHRVVFGGDKFIKPVVVTPQVLKQLQKLSPLMPLHLPSNLEGIEYLHKMYPDVPQVACFDTAFHSSQSELAKMFALPPEFAAEGVQHYGFHGLSYEYIASVMQEQLNIGVADKVIVAHLGNGSSMCAIQNGKSVATTMGFSALEGLVMGTRCGRIDPGVLLYLLEEKKYTTEQLQDLLYNKSGLLGVSGISNDVRELIDNPAPAAKLALDFYSYRAAQELAGLIVSMNGCDAIIFTGGIGEHAPLIRTSICDWLAWLGLSIDSVANLNQDKIINTTQSKIRVAVLGTNEEIVIAKHTLNIIPV